MNLTPRLVLGFAAVVLASGCAAEAGESGEAREETAGQAAALEVSVLVDPQGVARLEGPQTLEALREPLRVSGKSGDFVTESKRLPR